MLNKGLTDNEPSKGQDSWPKIEGKQLDKDDLGRKVLYWAPHSAISQEGVLASYRETGAIFVKFLGPQGVRCPSQYLTWG